MQNQLITPQEAVELSYNHGYLSTIYAAKAIADEWGRKYEDRVFDFYCMLSAVYTAGYIQGKREERAARHKEKTATN